MPTCFFIVNKSQFSNPGGMVSGATLVKNINDFEAGPGH